MSNPFCKIHNIDKRQKFNSTIFACPLCEEQKRIQRSSDKIKKNNELLGQSSIKTSKSSKNALKSKKKTPRQKAMDRADKYFSIYVRISKAVKIVDGEVFCQDIITDKIYNAKKIDNGHLFSRKFKTTRYHIDNCWPQNRSSNRFSGEADHYLFKEIVIKKIGDDRFFIIDQLRKQTGSDTLEFYEEQASKYLKLINDLAEEKGIKKWW